MALNPIPPFKIHGRVAGHLALESRQRTAGPGDVRQLPGVQAFKPHGQLSDQGGGIHFTGNPERFEQTGLTIEFNSKDIRWQLEPGVDSMKGQGRQDRVFDQMQTALANIDSGIGGTFGQPLDPRPHLLAGRQKDAVQALGCQFVRRLGHRLLAIFVKEARIQPEIGGDDLEFLKANLLAENGGQGRLDSNFLPAAAGGIGEIDDARRNGQMRGWEKAQPDGTGGDGAPRRLVKSALKVVVIEPAFEQHRRENPNQAGDQYNQHTGGERNSFHAR